ncbi:MAG: RnfABCDGE type electron transport complex subunit D, partial [Firmicutes bacterium]|nr:RnfABCDGE type electron transport complex subunit D [Bacillota bacterium]
MKNKLIVGASPHVTDKATTKRIMLKVCIALMPALIAGVVFFGFYAFLIVLVSVLSAVFFEYIWNILRNKRGQEEKESGFFKALWNFLRRKPNTIS